MKLTIVDKFISCIKKIKMEKATVYQIFLIEIFFLEKIIFSKYTLYTLFPNHFKIILLKRK